MHIIINNKILTILVQLCDSIYFYPYWQSWPILCYLSQSQRFYDICHCSYVADLSQLILTTHVIDVWIHAILVVTQFNQMAIYIWILRDLILQVQTLEIPFSNLFFIFWKCHSLTYSLIYITSLTTNYKVYCFVMHVFSLYTVLLFLISCSIVKVFHYFIENLWSVNDLNLKCDYALTQ